MSYYSGDPFILRQSLRENISWISMCFFFSHRRCRRDFGEAYRCHEVPIEHAYFLMMSCRVPSNAAAMPFRLFRPFFLLSIPFAGGNLPFRPSACPVTSCCCNCVLSVVLAFCTERWLRVTRSKLVMRKQECHMASNIPLAARVLPSTTCKQQ